LRVTRNKERRRSKREWCSVKEREMGLFGSALDGGREKGEW
jgi:hypothetical protein